LQIEHIVARARGGTNRVSNLTLACEACNQQKGVQDVRDFLSSQPERLARVLAQAKKPLKQATAVNATRWELFRRLQETGLPLETGSGGRTKYNRSKRGLPKTHWLDAACVGASTPERLATEQVVPLLIVATGHGRRKMCNTNDLGFPTGHRKRRRRYFGFQTGDQVRAVVPEGFAAAGTHVGRVMVRATGNFDITTSQGRVAGVPHRFCRPKGRNDGYRYTQGAPLATVSTPTSVREGGAIPPRINDGGILARFREKKHCRSFFICIQGSISHKHSE
jgi:hypothetical protein